MYYPSSENKGADQLRSYCEADLRLCFLIGNYPVFSQCGSIDNFSVMSGTTSWALTRTLESSCVLLKDTNEHQAITGGALFNKCHKFTLNEPQHEKTRLRPGPTQTGLHSHMLEIFGYK